MAAILEPMGAAGVDRTDNHVAMEMDMRSVPTLLIPGLCCSAELYRHQIPLLWQFGPVMIADHRNADTIAGIATQIIKQAPAKFALLGHSMGGFIAFEIMRRWPDRVSQLALISSTARPEIPGGPGEAIRAERVQMAKDGRFGALPPLHYATNVHPDRQTDEALRATHRRMTEAVGAAGYINQQSAIQHRIDSRPTLAGIKCPTLVLVGEQDALTPKKLSLEMASALAGSTLAVIADCGHLSTLEQPEAVNEAILAWRGRDAGG